MVIEFVTAAIYVEKGHDHVKSMNFMQVHIVINVLDLPYHGARYVKAALTSSSAMS